MSLTRRGFLFVLGAGAGVTLSPVLWKLTDDVAIWSQNWPWIPRLQYGALAKKPGLSKAFAGGSPLEVLTVAGRPVEAQGHADNPLSQGSLPAVAAPEVQMLYKAARVTGPMKKTGEGKYEPMAWEDAEALLAEKLKEAGPATAMITGDVTGTSSEVFSALLRGLGSTDLYTMPSEQQSAGRAWRSVMGGKGTPGYDIENSDCILALGPDLLESFGTPVRNAKAFSRTRPTGEKPGATWIYCGPQRTRTASVSDIYVPVPPGGEATFALGLANALIAAGASSGAADFAEFKSLVAAYTPAKVQDMIGVAPETMKKVVDALKAARRPLVVPGSAIAQGGSQAAFVAGMALNLLLGNVGRPGGVRPLPALPAVVSGATARDEVFGKDVVAWLSGVASGAKPAPKLLMVYEADPRYALPSTAAMNAALDKAGFTVSFSPFMDETSSKADLILPNPLCLERYDDLQTPYGSGFASYTLGTPVTKPVANGKATCDVLLGAAGKLGMNLGFSSFESVLEAKMQAVEGSGGFIAGQTQPWQAIAQGASPTAGAVADGLKKGKAWVSVRTVEQGGLSMGASLLAKAAAFKAPGSDFPLLLAPLYQLNVGTTHMAIPDYNLPTIREDELKGKCMFVFLNGKTAKAAGLSQGDTVTVSSAAGSVKGLVGIDESVMPGVVAAPMGFGHTSWDAHSSGKGDNLNKVFAVSDEPGAGLPTWAAVAVKIAKG
ncbi:molybdopterin oxidoreductase [Desulfovibrio sp. X2]|uniref:menaquinone reductase molybdopterin-binding-like subunit QrcB n=1 Tax=Desulfovibrio sp. X2 TaxID=941449 RepID=UPI000358D8CE|nr:menaquinone reductase molybdopterin-binding-like subunit QrcB [Desulfovibrio sp. X2]EPR41729.1 molybdopterin oxidoreductase [Desulfovibrio sp. X2]